MIPGPKNCDLDRRLAGAEFIKSTQLKKRPHVPKCFGVHANSLGNGVHPEFLAFFLCRIVDRHGVTILQHQLADFYMLI